jgi:hypothetical protein
VEVLGVVGQQWRRLRRAHDEKSEEKKMAKKQTKMFKI